MSQISNLKLKKSLNKDYKYGFNTNIEEEILPPGLTENTIKEISKIKKEPTWLLNWRLKAFNHWLKLTEPTWAELDYKPIDYQKISYFARPKNKFNDPNVIKTFKKLGVPIYEQERLSGVATDVVLDSVSIATSFQKELENLGIIFCPISEAILNHSDLVQKYLGSVVPFTDNFFASLNSAVFTDGSFAYIPQGVKCPMELSTYFRLNAQGTGQFERTLVIAEKDSFVSYLEGCTAPLREENQLHAAVVELIALENSEIKYSTIQNWYPGNKKGVGGVYNFVTKRGICKEKNSKISWTQVETGSSVTWKYPSVILKGDDSVGNFYSVALTKDYQQTDTGTKMTHIGKNTKSKILSKSISAGHSKNTFRSLVKVIKNATNSQNFTQCDSLILNKNSTANTIPTIEIGNNSSKIAHEASTGKVSEDILFFLQARGFSLEEANNSIINGYCKEIVQNLPMEFAIEAKKLLELKLEGTIG